MTNEQFARAKELRDRIEFIEKQIRLIDDMRSHKEDSAKQLVLYGGVFIPNGITRTAVLAVIRSEYENRLEEAKKEYEVL